MRKQTIHKPSESRQTGSAWLRDVVNRNRQGAAAGLYSVCSAHPAVLASAMRQAAEDGAMLCVESTSNQVNQFGGYTGLTPEQFRDYVWSIAHKAGFEAERILLGGDHLGPYPWRGEASAPAMDKACQLVRDCVKAGYTKIHLDASMACADDPGARLEDEVIARRAARMCKTAEEVQGTPGESLFYVVGTEVPVPGGEQSADQGPAVTKVEDAERTLEISRAAFLAEGLDDAWERVIGLVVQPGVEFGDAKVFDYDRRAAQELSRGLPRSPALVYEAHSTDYQKASGLQELVEDHFAILKVGPWLTFAFREAVFALSQIEREWLGDRRGVTLSRVRESLEEAMLRNPSHWQTYYSGSDAEVKFARQYSYSDRCRYYWPNAGVQRELQVLLNNLAGEMPLTLVSQYLPEQYEAVRRETISARTEELIEDRIRCVLRMYAAACATAEER
jgi:D-tagatose-1,6-bisphosphate aldolase subunit GatZ/KbaZ